MTHFTGIVRAHLVRLLEWEDAHAGFHKAVNGIAADTQGARASGFPHSPWELLEHIRLAQEDILEFCTSAEYRHREWPRDYWPRTVAPPSPDAWAASVQACLRDREALQHVARTVQDLGESVPTGTPGQTYLRAIMLAADHAAYHVGQLVAVRRALGQWTR